jgi:hypothetical protein
LVKYHVTVFSISIQPEILLFVPWSSLTGKTVIYIIS